MKVMKFNDILYFHADNQYELTSTFIRIQEFYESPFKNIRNNKFSLEDYIDTTYKNKQKFNYYDNWSGFNVPGHKVREFLFLNLFSLRKKEFILFKHLSLKQLLGLEKFYIIGYYKSEDILHEVAHALYYLKPDYKEEMNILINKYSTSYKTRLKNKYLKMGYCESVLYDEIQAYSVEENNKSFKSIFTKYINKDKSYETLLF